jgi:putative nucleotidyltransferase with HDIG domain
MILGFIILFLSVYTTCYAFALVSSLLFYTAVTKKCMLYSIFDINKRFSLQNYYRSLLPLYNPSAVFIFDKKGKLVFKNESAAREFDSIQNLSDFNNQEDNFKYETNEKTFQVNLSTTEEKEFTLAYTSDITQIIELDKQIEKTQKEIIYTMGEIGETRSKETGNHVKRVANYSYLLAKLYGLSDLEADLLKTASPMHDIGKVAIPDDILKKPSSLTESEFKTMKTHAKLGYNMLRKSDKPIIKAAAIVAYEHHEKYDGSGYPRGLEGNNIHIYGRITAVADVFDALGSDRVYKKAWDLEKILDLFKNERGKHFDPKLIDLFLEHLPRFLEIKERYKDISN